MYERRSTMKQTRTLHRQIFFTLIFVFTTLCVYHVKVTAASQNVSVNNGEALKITMNAGDTGTISPNLSFLPDSSVIQSYTFAYESDDPSIVTVDSNGAYTAISPGTVTVTVSVYSNENNTDNSSGYYYYSTYNSSRTTVFTATIDFTVNVDMTNVTLSTTNVYGYMYPEYYYNAKPSYTNASAQISINSNITIEETYDNSFSYTCSKPSLDISACLEHNTILIEQNSNTPGTATITFTIYGKTFIVNYTSQKVNISDQSCLLVNKKKKQLTVSGYEGKIVWKSSNPKIATVNANGVVKGQKIGNVIITARLGDQYLGCAVSVTTSKLKKVTERATYIGTHWKYSQALRTKKGYYDCSALVWKAYKEKAKVTFGSPGYPGVALTEAKWCKAHGKMIKGGLTCNKIKKMTVNPGDLLFKSSNMKKKYADIYHVEMFTGYFCHYVRSDGTAYYSPMWASRGTYYTWEEGALLGRPMK